MSKNKKKKKNAKEEEKRKEKEEGNKYMTMEEVLSLKCEMIRETWTDNREKKRMVAVVDNQTLALSLVRHMRMP